MLIHERNRMEDENNIIGSRVSNIEGRQKSFVSIPKLHQSKGELKGKKDSIGKVEGV